MKTLAFLLIALLALSSCGRRGAPSPPGPSSAIFYPHTYPSE